MHDLILGTAGHIDHGKTALVKALTGIDCDRLPEEKARGITIDIGFAHLELGGVRFGVVDCPGHERFIKNMLAGSTGIDVALLVVAADDGIMPQTREHLDILRLLGVAQGAIALTKVDLVPVVKRERVKDAIRELVRDTFLADATIVETSVVHQSGFDELRASLLAASEKVLRREESGWFRLAIDRAFVVQGHGTIVTGTVISGKVAVGEELEWWPSGERVRIRGLQNHDQPCEQVHRGQRAALNLAGVSHDRVERGQELATPGHLQPSTMLTVRLQALGQNRRPIKHRLESRLHLGTAEVMAKVALLDADEVGPGQWAFAQLFLDRSVMATFGQPFVLRDSSAEHTLGGGQVVQPVARKIRRRHLEVIERVERLSKSDLRERCELAAWFSGFTPIAKIDFVRGTGSANGPLADLQREGVLLEVGGGWLHVDRWNEIATRVLAVLAELHRTHPLMTMHDRAAVVAQLEIAEAGLVQQVIDKLLTTKQLVGNARRLARADFKPKLSANQRLLKDQIVEATRAGGFQPPMPSSFAAKAGTSLSEIYEVAVAEGLLVRVAKEMYLHADASAELTRILREKLRPGIGVTVAEIRDWLGTTRKYAVPLCEYLDAQRLTRRTGDLRYLQE